ncbi:hypothetical protein JXA34_04185 [Patescibacteria group bacterium]|nr:hypothetical protein [Patescibacteria group bacterium]
MRVLCLIFLCVIFLFPNKVYSSGFERLYFDFRPVSYLGSRQNEFKVDMRYVFYGYVPAEFRIKPQTQNGTAEIYSSQSGKWLSEFDEWSKLPDLSEDMRIRITEPLKADILDLSFIIQNKITGDMYETPTHKVYFLRAYGNYIDRINRNLISGVAVKPSANVVLEGPRGEVLAGQFGSGLNLYYITFSIVSVIALFLLGTKVFSRGNISK